MSTDNERELRDRLGVALDTIEPSRPPTGAVMRKGWSIRARRRAGVAAGLAGLVVLGATLPGIIGHRSSPTLNPSHHDRVSVKPPRVTKQGVIFSGTINGKPWRISLDDLNGSLGETGPDGSSSSLPLGTDGDPAVLEGTGDARARATGLVGPVGRNVVRLVLQLPGRASLVLHPVRWHGHRWVGLAVPSNMQLGRLTAYSARGEIAHAIPFGHNEFNMWLRPGQPGLSRQTVQVGSGTVDGAHWSVTGYAGPWGLCFQDSNGGSDCPGDLGSRLPNGALTAEMSCGGGPPQIATGQVGAAVSYLRIRLSDGSMRVPTVWLAGHRYFAFAVANKVRWETWIAYGASGQRLGSGNAFAHC
jgi:hypothetical protein